MGRLCIGADLSQQIYTAADTTSGYQPLTDRPFAGVLLGTASLLHDAAATRSVLGPAWAWSAPLPLARRRRMAFTN